MKTKALMMLLILMASAIVGSCSPSPTGKMIVGPEKWTVDVPYELGSTQDSGNGVLSSTAKIPVKNKADFVAPFKMTITCRTLKETKELSSTRAYILPQDTYTFEIGVLPGFGNDWECDNYRVVIG